MVLAVVETHAKINHWKSCQVPACRSVANPLFYGGYPVFRNRAAENIVDELDALAAFGGLHLDAADPELPVSAGLLFVFAFGVGSAANGFAVSDFGRLQRQVHVIALMQFRDHHFYVLLPGTRQQKFLRLR